MTAKKIAAVAAIACITAMCAIAPARASKMWVTGYYCGWQQQSVTPQEINFKVLTHVIYFALVPKPDGSLDATANSLTDANAAAIVKAAHRAHRKVLVCVGGENTGPAYEQAIAPAVRPIFVHNIVTWAMSRGFDGVDVDMEPILPQDDANFQAFIHALRAGLRAVKPHALITSAVGVTPAAYQPILADVDQINIMTYDMAGTWPGWETWYNSCLSNGGRNFRSVAKPLPSTEDMVRAMIAGGVPASKIGIGICANGVVWHGATGPNQPIDGVTTEGISYNDIVARYYSKDRYHWDAAAKAPYLSVDDPDKTKRAFVAYDDERACKAKVAYVRGAHLGGVIVWELGSAHNPATHRDPLLAAIGSAQ